MDPVVAWTLGALACAYAVLVLCLGSLSFLRVSFASGWGARGRRLSSRLAEADPDAVVFLTGPERPNSRYGTWQAVVVNQDGFTAYRASGKVGWSESWTDVRSVAARFGLLVIDREHGGPLSLNVKSDGWAELGDAELSALASRLRDRRPARTE